MAEFIGPVVEWLVGVLGQMEFGDLGLEAFAEVRQSWTGVVVNWPPAAVMPRSSAFDPEIQGLSHSSNLLTVKFGVNGTDPDEVTRMAEKYMKAVDDAIRRATPPEQVTHVHIHQHDYGPLYGREGMIARFPEMHVEVEVYEGLS